MKFLRNCIIALSMVLLSSFLADALSDDAKEMLKSMSEECREKSGATKEEVEKMANEEYPATKEGKCMVHCLQEQFGITVDGAYQLDTVKTLTEMMAGEDEAKRNVAGDIAEECKNEKDADKCEQAIKIGKCLEAAGKKRGFKAPGE